MVGPQSVSTYDPRSRTVLISGTKGTRKRVALEDTSRTIDAHISSFQDFPPVELRLIKRRSTGLLGPSAKFGKEYLPSTHICTISENYSGIQKRENVRKSEKKMQFRTFIDQLRRSV